MNKISINHLVKTFHGKTILNKISFDVYAGSVLGLLGGSGAGKSTLLRIISQLEMPDSGTIELHGKRVGIVLQQFHLWKHMTVLDNLITAPIHVQKIPRQKAIMEAEQLLLQLNILEKSHHYPCELSGGEQQRAAIARALMMKPDIMLFDEPTSALDPERTQNVVNIIKSLAKSGITIVLATHDLGFAKQAAETALFLERGEIQEVSPIKNQQFTPQTARFVEFLNQAA